MGYLIKNENNSKYMPQNEGGWQPQAPQASPQYSGEAVTQPSIQQSRKKHGKRNLLIILAFVVVLILVGFVIAFNQEAQTGPETGGSTSTPSDTPQLEPLIKTEQEALDALKSFYTYFPSLVAQTKTTEQTDYWAIEVRIPGEFVFEKQVDKYTGKISKTVQINGIHSTQIVTEEMAKEMFLYAVRNNEINKDDIVVIGNGDTWVCRYGDYSVSIRKDTGHYSAGGL